MKLFDYAKSKTVLAGIIAGSTKIFATLFPLAAAGAFGVKAQGVAYGVAAILAAVGVKSAIVKAGTGEGQ